MPEAQQGVFQASDHDDSLVTMAHLAGGMVAMSWKLFGTSASASVCCTWQAVQKYRRGVTSASTCPSRSMKCVTLIIGAPEPSVYCRRWQSRQRLARSVS